MKTYLLFTLSLFCTTFILAQNFLEQNVTFESIKSIQYDKDVQVLNFFESEFLHLGLQSPNDMSKLYEIDDKSGYIHTKYKQTYKGLPVLGGTYILHSKNGTVKSSTGNLYPNINLNIKPSIEAAEAETAASYAIIERFSNQYENFDVSRFNVEVLSSSLCIIDPAFPSFSGQYHLAYEIEIKAFLNIPIKEKIYIDASDNEVLNHYSDIAQEGIIGNGKTLYYGERTFEIDSISENKYLLQDLSRGNGIYTIDASQPYDGTEDFGYPVFSSESKTWNFPGKPKETAALDAHFSTIQFYDMLKNRFDRNSIDDDGVELVCAVHVLSPFYVNAYWDGDITNYGDGNCDKYGPLTTLDIIGHEFTHGLTDYTSDLVYKNESGAINESISDIFGKALEYYTIPDEFNWLLGNTMIMADDVDPFRNMKDPNIVDDPKYYQGINWESGISDNGGVHTNSSVFNYWFYSLVEGNSGENEGGYIFDVQAIGMDKALDIVYGVEVGYLTESSAYVDLYFATIAETKALYGDASMEVVNVIEAWNAVGIYEDTNQKNLNIGLVEEKRGTETLCAFDDPYVINYKIGNKGVDDYLPGTEIDIEILLNTTLLKEITITLIDTLSFNEVLEYTDSVELSEDLFKKFTNYLKVRIGNEDSNMNDNELEIRMRNLSSDIDLQASIYSNTLQNLCTPIQDQRIRCRVLNKSCTALEEDDVLTFIFENDEGKFTQTYSLPSDLEPNKSRYVLMDFDVLPTDFGVFNITLEYAGDTILDNNTFVYDGPGVYKQLERNKTIDFSDDSYMDYIKQRPSFYNVNEIVEYKGDNKMGFLGQRNFGNVAECSDPNDFFISQVYSSIGFCVDAFGMNNPMLSFDLNFIQNQVIDDFNISEDYYTMAKVILEGEAELPLIYIQENGVSVKQEIVLPIGYAGTVQIAIYVLGKEDTDSSDMFEGNNWVLLDNIRFYDLEDVATKDLPKLEFNVSPNPTSQLVTFIPERENQKYNIRFFDILGKELDQRNSVHGILNYDASKLGVGTFLYQIDNDGSQISFGKLVVIK